MPALEWQFLIGVVAAILGSGVLFEAGRRIGRSSQQHDDAESDIDDLDQKIESRFDQLDARLDNLEHQVAIAERERDREHKTVIGWLGNLTDAMRAEGYDVSRPDEVAEVIDVSDDIGVKKSGGAGKDDD